jgi:regulator of RNase E activity RraA
MNRIITLTLLLLTSGIVASQEMYTPQGVSMLPNKSFDNSDEARQEILDLYRNLRVTDVLDGMDLIGLQDIGLMDNDIRPFWRDTENFSHRILGFAVTVRYVPTDVRVGENSFDNYQEYEQWKRQQYGRANNTGWLDASKPGDVLVLDVNGSEEAGIIGSNNSLGWKSRGIIGIITNGSARDTDEIIKTCAVPVYSRNAHPTRGIIPGRVIIESYNYPINCAGALVYPGDLIVADGDGVIVVPREHALEVGKLAREVMEGAQTRRVQLFKDLGIPLDETVKPYEEK